jgi:hypothetical protein
MWVIDRRQNHVMLFRYLASIIAAQRIDTMYSAQGNRRARRDCKHVRIAKCHGNAETGNYFGRLAKIQHPDSA